MNINAYETDSRQYPNRDNSIATIETRSTTTSKKLMLNTRGSISSATSSTRRPSAPLSIAERFMSPNYNSADTIITMKDESLEEKRSNVMTSCSDIGAPNNRNAYDRLSPMSPPPLFLSSDPSQQDEPYQPVYSNSHHPLDVSFNRTVCNCSHQNICSSKTTHETVFQTKKKKKRRTSHHLTRKHNRAHIHSISSKLAVVEEDLEVKYEPLEKPKKMKSTGIWIGRCCFIRCGGVPDETLPSPILKDRRKKSQDHPCCCCGRRTWVISIFLCVVMVAVMVFLFYPRVPLIRIEGAINTVPTKATQTQQGGRTSNVAFESTWLLNVTMDNRRNYITTRLNRVQIIAKDAMTGLLIGKGLNNDGENGSGTGGGTVIYLPGRTISTIQLPISVNYQARDHADTTFSNLLRACAVSNGSISDQNITMIDSSNTNSNGMPVSMIESTSRHALLIHFWFTLYIFGLDWIGYKPTVIATPATGGFFCPSSST